MTRASLFLRRVGFRAGTDAELIALHAVVAPIESERRSHRELQPLDSYIAFARSLPSQFDDHVWLVEIESGAPVATGFCWSTSTGDREAMECDVFVRQDFRRRGIGAMLLQTICEEAAAERRSLLTWSTFDAVLAGDAFSRSVGAAVARVNRTSELAIADVDWTKVAAWARAGESGGLGYSVEIVQGVIPEALHTEAVALHRIMQSAPRDNLQTRDKIVDADFVAEIDSHLVAAGRERWTLFVRDAHGACVGGTELIFEPWDPAIALQQNTGIDPAHRGQGLARWIKATMLERIRSERPHVERVRTDNAFSNVAMVAINDALGFVPMTARTEWQAEVDLLSRALTRP